MDVYDIDAEEDNYENEVYIMDNEGGNVNLNSKKSCWILEQQKQNVYLLLLHRIVLEK